MKVGTDAVLLGSWMQAPEAANPKMLDVGTGTGVIALMAAQRYSDAEITAIDSDAPSVEEATENFGNSPWSDRLAAKEISLQRYAAEYPAGTFDLVFSNPPFYTNDLKAPNPRRSAARHTESLPFPEFVSAADRLLKPSGMLAVVLPVEEGRIFVREAAGIFHLSRVCRVRGTAGKPPKRLLMEFVKADVEAPSAVEEEELTLQDGPHRTPEYTVLTQEFYLSERSLMK